MRSRRGDVFTGFGPAASKDAIKKIGQNPVNRKSLVEALNSFKNYDTGGLTVPLSYGAGYHDPDKCFQWIQKRSGTWTTYSDWKCF